MSQTEPPSRVPIGVPRAIAAMLAVICFAVCAPRALAVESGTVVNPCIAHAIAMPGVYESLQAMNEACGLPTNRPNESPATAPRLRSPGEAAPASTPINGHIYYIYSGDSETVINAKACHETTILFTYPVVKGCEGGGNELWDVLETTSHARVLVAQYGRVSECMIAGSESGVDAGAAPCTDPLESYMEFRKPEVSEACYKGWYYIIPLANHELSLNVDGGLGTERNIITYPKGCHTNSVWYYELA